MSAWVSYALRQGQFSKPVLVSSADERIECLFCREHLLIVIRVEIAPDHNAFDRQHCSFNHVVDVRHKLSNGDLTFLNVLCRLGLFITVSDQIAL